MNVCGAVPFEPSASVAVTVTVAVPSDIGVTITVLPDTNTAATPGADGYRPVRQRIAVRVPLGHP